MDRICIIYARPILSLIKFRLQRAKQVRRTYVQMSTLNDIIYIRRDVDVAGVSTFL